MVPGNAVLTLDKAGSYTIYHEKKSTVDGRYYASETVSGLRLRLTDDATGAPVKLTEPAVASSYAIGNKSRLVDLRLCDRPAGPIPAGRRPG